MNDDLPLIFSTRRLIPTNTDLTQEQWDSLLRVIKDSKKHMRKLKRGDIELSFWSMERLEHLRALKEHNKSKYGTLV